MAVVPGPAAFDPADIVPADCAVDPVDSKEGDELIASG
jgi:hypothetical protein